MVEKQWKKFLALIGEVRDLAAVLELLEWDMQVNLPENAAAGRGSQIETLSGIHHEKATSKALGNLLDTLERASFPPGSFEQALLRRAKRDYDRERLIPAALVRELGAAGSAAFGAWLKAREEQDFSVFAPHLERLLELKRSQAALYRPAGHLLDPLLDDYEEALTVAELDPLFGVLRREQAAIVRKAVERGLEDDSFLRRKFPAAKQLELAEFVARRIGYDFRRGRIDQAEHPFTTSFGLSDVRITTKVFPQLPLSCLFSTIHEAGHAIYEQGIDPSFDRTPLADGASLAFHESQSRLWENQVGRSLPFWRWLYPVMQKRFGGELGGIPLETFLRAVNRVEPSLIRIEADEATYNLHIILRYELEKELIEGSLSTSELPEAWNAKMEEYLGVIPPNDRLGVLQDVHWTSGGFGYFPTYALGNLIAAQVWELAHQAIPELEEEIAAGKFDNFREYLRANIHRYGAKLPPRQLLKQLTGSETPDPRSFLAYLEKKFA